MSRATENGGQRADGSKPASDSAQAGIREHVRHVLESPEFHGSHRSREFLNFIVETTLEGHEEQIKERTIAEVVFGRPAYDPATDTLVRVSAKEVRKRLAKFYESNPGAAIRISLPPGGYVPEFLPVQEPAAEMLPSLPAYSYRRPGTRVLVALALLLLAVGGISFYARRGSPFDDLWRPLIQGGEPVIVSNPSGGTPRFLVYPQNVEEFQRALRAGTSPLSIPSGEIAVSDQMVSVGNMQAILAIAGLLREHRKGALPRIASEFVPGDNRDRPMILVGAFSNAWTLDLSAAQRFRFFSEGRGQQYQAGVLDSSSSRRWYAQLRNHAWEASLDYAVISRVWNSYGQVVLSVAGVTHLGTQAAAEFITNAHSWSELVRGAPRGWQKKNFQILLETKIVGKSANAPKVVEFHLW